MRYLYRCSKEACKVRRALKRQVEFYLREPKCKRCGSRLRLDKHRMHETRAQRCHCDGYAFPHRKGSKWCRFYAGVLTDEDYAQRH